MQSLLFRLLLLLAFCGASAQNSVTITGKILDNGTQVPLESATVYLTKVSDSTVIDYTITKRDGTFAIAVKKNALPALLKISYIGYQNHIQRLEKDMADKDFGIIRLSDNANMLGEVVVKAEAPPIRIKNDTLEFNASSFKVRPDSNVETLLKQLPGVEIDAEGKITVNGKEVKQVLVNGKPFFDADGKIALQNLPSDIINKVQITDKKTKQEEIAGKPASSSDASINLTIDEDKNKGVFGKFMGGMGSSGRYESSFMFNYFKNKRKLSVLGSANNINSVGFSMNEIFDSMGGGRNTSIYMSDNGSFGINGMRFGGGKGITRSNLGGLSYNDEFFKGFDFGGNYFYMAAHTDNNNRTKEVTFLPDGNFTTESVAKTRDDKFSHNVTGNIEYKIDSTATLYISPKFNRGNARYGNTYQQRSYSDNLTLNESRASTFNEQTSTGASNSIYFNKNLKRKGSRIAADFDHDNNKDEIQYLNQSETIFHDETGGGAPDRFDRRDQKRWERNLKDNYFASFEYQQGLTDSLNVHMGFEYIHNSSSFDKNTFDFETTTQGYSDRNDSLSQYLKTRLRRWNPKVGFNIERKKFNWYVDLGTSVMNLENQSLYLGTTTRLQKKYLLPFANSNFRYSFGKSMNFYASYWYNVDVPQAREILPVADFSDPLNTVTGNPNLDPNIQHSLYLNLGKFDYQTKTGINFYAGGNFYENRVVASSTYDASRKRFTTYANVSGTYNSWFGGNWNKSFKNEAHSFKYRIGMNSNLERNKGFVDGKLYAANSLRLSPGMSFTYDYGELLSINPSYTYTYNDTQYTNFTISQANYSQHRANLQLTTYWPKHFVFGNDFGYTYNTQIADGFKKDFLLWNISLGYNFLSDHFLAKVKVYDVLNQNQNATRSIWASGIRDEQNDVLRRYVMFSLTYKLEKFAGKKKESNNFWFWD